MACLSSSLIYGESGVGKTGQVGSFAKWVKFRYGKKTRLYTAESDLGTIEHLLGEFIEVANLKDRPNMSETLVLASQGWWPSEPDSDKGPGYFKGEWKPTTDWSGVGGVVYEGATEFGNDLLQEFRVKGAVGEILSAEKAPATFISGKMKFAGNNETHYGIAQGRLKEAINNSQKLPIHLLWTARELKIQDKDTRQFLYGPMLAGKAATKDAPAWFGNCIHIDVAKVTDPKTKLATAERRMYLWQHYDEDGEIPFLAKMRVPPEFAHLVPQYLPLTPDLMTMVTLFDLVDSLRAKARANAAEQQTLATTKT